MYFKALQSLKTLVCFLLLMIILTMACQQAKPIDQPVEPDRVIYRSSSGLGKQVVLVSGDEEYRSEEALPLLGQILADQGFNCTVLFAQDPQSLGVISPNYQKNIPGLETLDQADLLILFTRFRDLPDSQMAHFEKYLLAGKPVIAIRTATHAFQLKDTASRFYPWSNSYKDTASAWDGGFGRLVLGEKWYTHHGHHQHQSTRGMIAPGAENHPILSGITSGSIWGPTDVYGVRLPLPEDAQVLVLGQVVDRSGIYNDQDPLYGLRPSDTVPAKLNPATKEPYDPNDPMMPIAWTKSYQLPGGVKGTAFTSTIGAATDMLNEGVRRLLVNAVYYLTGQDIPTQVNVELIKDYQPSAYAFKTDSFWQAKNLKVSDFILPE